MNLFHNSQDLKYRRPFGAAVCGARVELRLEVTDAPPSAVISVSINDEKAGETLLSMEYNGLSMYSASFNAPEHATLLWYHFIVRTPEYTVYYGNNDGNLGGAGREYPEDPLSYQITVYEKDTVPDWFTGGIAYQIFPDRFARGADWRLHQQAAERPAGAKGGKRIVMQDWDDTPFYSKDPSGAVTRWPFFGGDLDGIRENLPYLKSLGVSVLYLNPVFRATSNHKYDTADYMEIDPSFGDEKSFRRLCRDAGRTGIRIILDGVFSHTGADSKYFNKFGNYDTFGACQGKNSRFFNWYRFCRYPDKYESWWGVGDLPNTEETEPSFAAYIYGRKNSVIRHWLRAGAKGWRLDVADELPDSFIRGVRAAMLETDPDSLLMGEVWEDASNKCSYGVRREYFYGQELQSTMNYPFRTSSIDFMLGRDDAGHFSAVLMSLMENYPRENFYAAFNLIGSHDRARILTVLGDAPQDLTPDEKEYYTLPPEKLELARNRLKILSLLQFTMPGVPCVYYGDEAGAQGYEDPYNRGTFPWGREDGALLRHYRSISALRRTYRAFTAGDFSAAGITEHVLRLTRCDGASKMIVFLNRGIFEWQKFPRPESVRTVYSLSPNGEKITSKNGMITLPPLSAVVMEIK